MSENASRASAPRPTRVEALGTVVLKRPENPEMQAQRALKRTETNPFRFSVPVSTRESVFESRRQQSVMHEAVSQERQQQTSRKRPYSATQEELDDQLDRTSHANSSLPHPTTSYAYVSNQGDYCCALCMTRLSSEHTLAQHELKSQLHLANLKNLTVVSKGRAFLAQIMSVSRRSSHEPSPGPPPTMKLGGFDHPNGSTAAGRRSSIDPLQDSMMHESSHTDDRHNAGNDTILLDLRSSTIGPQTGSQDHQPMQRRRISSLEITEALRPDKGKGPAREQSIERHLAAAPRRPPVSNMEARSQVFEQQPAIATPPPSTTIAADPCGISPSPPLEHSLLRPFQSQVHPLGVTTHARPYSHSSSQPTSDDESKLLIQTFISTGMTLAKKYVDDHHPELVPHLHRLIHDSIEFPTMPTATANGEGQLGSNINGVNVS